MVATSQPLASASALRVLQDGGNAVDAAIAAAAVLNVVEPTMTGIGGDMFALVFMQKDGHPVGLNGSGWAGSKARPEDIAAPGLEYLWGIHTVTVPGAVAGWFELHNRYGTVDMSQLLEPAIAYAEDGFAVSEIVAGQWQRVEDTLRSSDSAVRTFLPEGRAPKHGDVFRNPDLAASLRLLADGGRDAFYTGDIARAIVRTSDALDGFLTLADFEEFDAQWVEPVSTTYRGYDVFEMPPNTQGIIALEMLNILEGFDLKAMGHNSVEYLHTLIEAKKLAFADRAVFIADPNHAKVPTGRLISKAYAGERRAMIDPGKAGEDVTVGISAAGDTVYFTVADRDGNVVSFINSLFESFGSRIVPEGTGICLHNRGSGFSLEPDHPNRMAPRKRPFHTLIPAMVLDDGRPYFSFGVMGGDMQAQGHVQVLANLIDFGMDVQQAGEVPRFRHDPGQVALESAIGTEVRKGLAEKGHNIVSAFGGFGGYQGILIDPKSGVLMGGSDPRKDGLALGW
jgi:gamma-glutamyltranspeptidase/glutathione hydrolase